MHDPDKIHYRSAGWGVYYFTSERWFLALFLALAIFIKNKTWFDIQFLIIEISFNFWLGLAYYLNYKEIINRTYNTEVMLGAIILTTVAILISGFRHGIFQIHHADTHHTRN